LDEGSVDGRPLEEPMEDIDGAPITE